MEGYICLGNKKQKQKSYKWNYINSGYGEVELGLAGFGGSSCVLRT